MNIILGAGRLLSARGGWVCLGGGGHFAGGEGGHFQNPDWFWGSFLM